MSAPKRTHIRRYTSMASALDIIQNKRITLLSPKTWDDRNDAFLMDQYKEKKGLKNLHAICFAEASETYHHWRVFTHSSDGICITFKKDVYLDMLEGDPNLESRTVDYLKIQDVKKNNIPIDSIPFTKRHAFKAEQEFRTIYKSRDESRSASKIIPIELSCISTVIINPWLPAPLYETVKSIFRQYTARTGIRIRQSNLIDNQLFKASILSEGS
ncbi:hypothetical protein RYZ27_00810 [Hyphomonas sp. FCG-A18]|jgi:hypothetical protein|uniref:hypothetical protein n=1 Tax=Hyphomonas sp. FCG-A18 TaxID=3080019 RepID=UPI002B31FB44|nr:hypothetical protein RYZ27_00810 [Hyphomonas sp. FCG-A18]